MEMLGVEMDEFDAHPARRVASFVGADDRLSRRYARDLQFQQEITYEFTKDPGLLHQYYRLREAMFISVWGLHHFSGAEDSYDTQSEVVIARKGNLCLGGARLILRTPDKPGPLPMENKEFQLPALLPELQLENKVYTECSRLAVLPEFRMPCTIMLYRHIKQKAIDLGVDYLFILAPHSQTRGYRLSFKKIDLDHIVREDIAVPDREEYEGIKMCFSYIDFREFKQSPDEANATEKTQAFALCE